MIKESHFSLATKPQLCYIIRCMRSTQGVIRPMTPTQVTLSYER